MVKLLDFGLAKRSNESSSPGLSSTLDATQAGMILGTPAYMSPEQAEGKPADARSDIFCFGAILYEMLSGNRAFPGASAASALGALLHREPDPLQPPSALAAVTVRCLAKPPGLRFRSATDLLQALEQASAAAAIKPIPVAFVAAGRRRFWVTSIVAAVLFTTAVIGLSLYLKNRRADSSTISSIAVIPFDMRSKDPDADYIADGISESINIAWRGSPVSRSSPTVSLCVTKGKPQTCRRLAMDSGADSSLWPRTAAR